MKRSWLYLPTVAFVFTVSADYLTGAKMKEKEDLELNPEEKEELVREIRDLYRILIPDKQIEEDR